MCGITGIYNYNSFEPVNKQILETATSILAHRGPDQDGFYFNDNILINEITKNQKDIYIITETIEYINKKFGLDIKIKF